MVTPERWNSMHAETGPWAFRIEHAARIPLVEVERFVFGLAEALAAAERGDYAGGERLLCTQLRVVEAAYAAEELVAELSSAMLGAELGLPVAHLDSHASYIEHWLKLLRDDDRAILTAAAKAEEASSLLLGLGGRTIAGDGGKADDVALAA